jgi:hypothetical protein
MRLLFGVVVILTMLASLPIWYFLLYEILRATQADRLEWFLFWVYVPVSFAGQGAAALFKYANDELEKKRRAAKGETE